MRNKITALILFLLLASAAAQAAQTDAAPGAEALPRVSIVSPAAEDADGASAQTEAPKAKRIADAATAPPLDGALKDFYGRKKRPVAAPGTVAAPGGAAKDAKAKAPATEEKEEGKAPSQIYDEVPLPAVAQDDEAGGRVALPEVTQKVMLSRSDVNRIVCSEPIKDVKYSDEKGLSVSYYGNNAFLKFQFEQVGEKVIYSKTPTEMHVLCGGSVYTLVAVPMPMPPQTVRLDSGNVDRMRKNASIFKDTDTDRKIEELMRRAYRDDLPESFIVKKQDVPLSIFRDVAVSLRRTITVDGEGIVVKEFSVTPNVDGIELKEKQFLRKEISATPSGIAFEPGKLKPAKGDHVRLFVVEFKGSMPTEGGADAE